MSLQEGHFITPASQLLTINPAFIWLSSVDSTSLKTGHSTNWPYKQMVLPFTVNYRIMLDILVWSHWTLCQNKNTFASVMSYSVLWGRNDITIYFIRRYYIKLINQRSLMSTWTSLWNILMLHIPILWYYLSNITQTLLFNYSKCTWEVY